MKAKYITLFLAAFLSLGIFAPSAMASGSDICPTGECKLVPAEWVPGTTITASGGSGTGSGTGGGSSSSFVRETPVSKLVEIKKSYEKKYKVVVGYYQDPNGYQGDAGCIDPTKVKRWNFHAGDYYRTTNHLLERVPPAHWKKGDKACDWKEVTRNGQRWVVFTQGLCSNVKSEFRVDSKIRKPRRVYVQFPTVEKFYEVAIKRLEIKSEAKGGSGSGSGEGGDTTIETPGHWTCKTGELVGNTCKICPPPHCSPDEEPIVTDIETINDMWVSRNGDHFQRWIYFSAYPALGESLSDLEVVLRVDKGVVFGEEAQNVGGNRFRQLYESPSEIGTETYWGWARSKKTGAIGQSEHKTFPIKPVPSGG